MQIFELELLVDEIRKLPLCLMLNVGLSWHLWETSFITERYPTQIYFIYIA